MHCAIALAPTYYLLPVQLPVIGLRRWVLLVGFFASVAVFDYWRRTRGITFLGLRPHERWGVASFLWAAAGITLVLWLVPHDLATASLVAMAFADPLAGELRRARKKPLVAVSAEGSAYFAIAFAVLILTGLWSPPEAALLAAVGALVAVPSEAIKTSIVDDDFSMLVFPGTAISLVAALI